MSSKQFSFLLIFLWSLYAAPEKAAAQQAVSFQIFYDQLSPYGTWVNDLEYGYVWVPGVESGFAPYSTNGYWLLTDAGWTWMSDYPWGWAPFHYGRWYTDPLYGPVWMPDYAWSPAWVSWRSSQSYYGWAPLPPSRGHGHRTGNSDWVFVRNQDFGKRDVHNYYVPRSRNGTIMPYSTVVTNNQAGSGGRGRYNAGPGRTEVESRTGRTIAPVRIVDRNEAGQELTADNVQLYRPTLQQPRSGGSQPAPSSVSKWKDVKQRKTTAPKAPTSSEKWRTQNADPSAQKWDAPSSQKAAPARQSDKKWNAQPSTPSTPAAPPPTKKWNAQPSTPSTAPARESTRKWEAPSTQRAAPVPRTAPAPRTNPAPSGGKWQSQPAPKAAPARQPGNRNGG